jgi:hypothetical protein
MTETAKLKAVLAYAQSIGIAIPGIKPVKAAPVKVAAPAFTYKEVPVAENTRRLAEGFFLSLKVAQPFTGTYTNLRGKATQKTAVLYTPVKPGSNCAFVVDVVNGHIEGKQYRTRLDRWAIAA